MVPVVRAVSPPLGSVAGGTTVTVAGSGFVDGAALFFGSVPAAAMHVDGPTSITAISPAGAEGAADVRVVNPNGASGVLSGGFAYVAPPGPSGLGSLVGTTLGGDVVTISGARLGRVTGVRFGGEPAVIRFVQATNVVVETPPHAAGSVDVVVSNPVGSVLLPVTFTYVDPAAATARAGGTATALAQATAAARATETAVAGATFAAATATAAGPGRSPASALVIPVGASITGVADGGRGVSWYRFDAQAGRTYSLVASGVGGSVDTQLGLWRVGPSPGDPGTPRAVAFNDDDPADPTGLGSRVRYTAETDGALYASVTAPTGTSFVLVLADLTVTLVPTPAPSTPTPTATTTPTPTATPTEVPTVAAVLDNQEPNDSIALASLMTVGAGPSGVHLFTGPGDADLAKFVVQAPGRHVVRTLDLTGGADPAIALLQGDGSLLLDPDTGLPVENDDDYDATGEPGAALASFNAYAADLGRTVYVRVRNANQGVYGAGVGYRLRVDQLAFTPTPIGPVSPPSTATPTRTPTATQTPAPADPYETDDGRTLVDARGPYELKRSIRHAGSETLTANRAAGPAHTFHVAADEDWLALKLPVLFEGSQLNVRVTNTGVRSNGRRTEARLSLYRPHVGSTSAAVRRSSSGPLDGLVRVGRGLVCPDDPNSRCATVRFEGGGELLYSNQVWYLRVWNFDPELFGHDAAYELTVRVDQPGVPPTPTPAPTATAPGPSATPTPEPLRGEVSPDRSTRLRTSNGSTSIDVPRGALRSGGLVEIELEQRDPAVGQTIAAAARSRRGSSADPAPSLTPFRYFVARAFDVETDQRITRFNASVTLCTTFTIHDLTRTGIDQAELRPYHVDPATGELSTTGVVRTKLLRASSTQPGELCLKTAHFSTFVLAGPSLGSATPTPTAGLPVPTPGRHRVIFYWIFQARGGW
jgi:hypothetical protein